VRFDSVFSRCWLLSFSEVPRSGVRVYNPTRRLRSSPGSSCSMNPPVEYQRDTGSSAAPLILHSQLTQQVTTGWILRNERCLFSPLNFRPRASGSKPTSGSIVDRYSGESSTKGNGPTGSFSVALVPTTFRRPNANKYDTKSGRGGSNTSCAITGDLADTIHSPLA
jgi:hypothetical protein